MAQPRVLGTRSSELNWRRVVSVWMTSVVILSVSAPGLADTSFWDQPRKGANFFDRVESASRFQAAADAGFEVIRLVPDKWQGAQRDFLLGSADDFTTIPPADLAKLKQALDWAQAAKIKVVVGMLSLPGNRWAQLNKGRASDFRLYREPKFQAQAVEFWRQLARALAGHPAVVGYNIVNEPHPSKKKDTKGFDLSAFYDPVIAAIRESDPVTPVILDGDDYGSPEGIRRLRPAADPSVIYAFHYYGPWEYASGQNKNRWTYPGMIPEWDGATTSKYWDADAIAAAMAPVVSWQKQHGIPANRVWAAEFGIVRTNPGASRWLEDVVATIERHGWHWALYAFREDVYPAMDLELGTNPGLGMDVWAVIDRGGTPNLKRGPNPLWDVVSRRLKHPAK
jgi:hypothetical protein